LEYS